MFGYIASRPKGTFTDEQLQRFVKKGWITQDQYNQLATTDNLQSQTQPNQPNVTNN